MSGPAPPAFRVLGGVDVVDGGQPVPLGERQRVLLGVLLARRNRPVALGELVDNLWGDDADHTAALHTQVSRLRKVLVDAGAPGRIETSSSGYTLVVGDDDVDAGRFEALAHSDASEPAESLVRLEAALALWRGPAFGTLADRPALQAEAVRLDELHLAVCEARGAALVAAGRPELAVAELEPFARAHPLREAASETLMRALYACGRQSDALGHYRRHREHLAEELGIEPSVALQRLELEILQHRVETPADDPPAALDRLQISYVRRSDGHAVAVASLGEGPPVVAVPAWVTSLEVIGSGRDPRSSLLERLAHHVRLTLYDRLGTGLSPGPVDDFSAEAAASELLAVLEHTGPAALLAVSQAGPGAVLAATVRPELVTHLVLVGTFADARQTFADERTTAATVELVRAHWGLGSRLLADLYRPGASQEVTDHLARVMRDSAPPEVAAGYLEAMFRTDVSPALADVRAPALVLHYTGDRVIPFRGGQDLASGLPDNTFVPLNGDYHLPDVGDLDRIVATIVDFVSR